MHTSIIYDSFESNQLVTHVQIDSCAVKICIAAEVKHERIERAINIRQATWNFGFNGRRPRPTDVCAHRE